MLTVGPRRPSPPVLGDSGGAEDGGVSGVCEGTACHTMANGTGGRGGLRSTPARFFRRRRRFLLPFRGRGVHGPNPRPGAQDLGSDLLQPLAAEHHGGFHEEGDTPGYLSAPVGVGVPEHCVAKLFCDMGQMRGLPLFRKRLGSTFRFRCPASSLFMYLVERKTVGAIGPTILSRIYTS